MTDTNWTRREAVMAGAGAALLSAAPAMAQTPTETIEIDTRQVTGPLDHIWVRCAGSDRAAMTLREGWRRDLHRFRHETGLESVRFHGIFNDELGVWPRAVIGGRSDEPNFQNVDAVYDAIVETGVRPFVELSFMPSKLASGQNMFGFYNANITPPSTPEAWGAFITQFAQHLVDRYGIVAVRQWHFECWNEPNLPFFWSGTQEQYFDLYKATAVALKSVDANLRVGGPATSAGHWLPEFLEYCANNNAPLDFVSTHAYAGDREALARHGINNSIPATAAEARAQIDASRFANLPMWLNEWGADSPAMIAHIIKECLPSCYAMGQWNISGSYEELRVADYVLKEGNNGWSMIAPRNIAKPAFNTYKLMHKLGTQRLNATGPALAARDERGVTALIWNLAEVPQPAGIPDATAVRTVTGETKTYNITFRGARRGQRVHVSYVDQERGSPFPAWRAMGSPRYPNPAQLGQIRASAEIASPERHRLSGDGVLSLTLPPEGVALIEFE